MDVVFTQKELQQLETDRAIQAGLPGGVVRAYRGRIQALRAAPGEEALRPLRSFDLLQDGADGAYSLRINDDWRLLVSFEGGEKTRVTVVHAIVKRSHTEPRS